MRSEGEEMVDGDITETVSNVETKSSKKSSREKKLQKKLRNKQMAEKAASDDLNRGISKSGNFWKTPKTQFRTMFNSVKTKSSEKHLKLRKEMKHIKELSKSIKDERKHDNEVKKVRREQNAARRLENERKSETVQVIKNTAKIKRMKKKELRKIEKRDLSTVKVV